MLHNEYFYAVSTPEALHNRHIEFCFLVYTRHVTTATLEAQRRAYKNTSDKRKLPFKTQTKQQWCYQWVR